MIRIDGETLLTTREAVRILARHGWMKTERVRDKLYIKEQDIYRLLSLNPCTDNAGFLSRLNIALHFLFRR